MDFKKTLSLLFLSTIFLGCPDMRDLTICKINVEHQIASCANNDVTFEVPLGDLEGWFAMNEVDLRKIMQKLENCNNSDKGVSICEGK